MIMRLFRQLSNPRLRERHFSLYLFFYVEPLNKVKILALHSGSFREGVLPAIRNKMTVDSF